MYDVAPTDDLRRIDFDLKTVGTIAKKHEPSHETVDIDMDDETTHPDKAVHLFEKLEDPKQRAFVGAFRLTGIIKKASAETGIDRKTHYAWMSNDESYRAAFHASRDTVCDHIEGALIQRLIHGWEEPVYQGGELVGTKRKFDNATAMRYLERISPKFKPQAELDISIANPIQFYLPDNGRNPEDQKD